MLRFQKLRTDPEVFLLAQLVAQQRQVALSKMLRRSRGSGHAAAARQLAIYLSNVLLERPQEVVADLFQRNHSTVAHAVQSIENLRDTPSLEAEIGEIEARFTGEVRHAA